MPSRRPSTPAEAPLEVASAGKPSPARIRAEPASHALAIRKNPGAWCSARNRSAFWCWLDAMSGLLAIASCVWAVKVSKQVGESFPADSAPLPGAAYGLFPAQNPGRRHLGPAGVPPPVEQILGDSRSVRGLPRSAARRQSVSALAHLRRSPDLS